MRFSSSPASSIRNGITGNRTVKHGDALPFSARSLHFDRSFVSHNDSVADAQAQARTPHFRTSRSFSLIHLKNRSKTCGSSSAGIPDPVSSIANRTVDGGSSSTTRCTWTWPRSGDEAGCEIPSTPLQNLARVLTVAVNPTGAVLGTPAGFRGIRHLHQTCRSLCRSVRRIAHVPCELPPAFLLPSPTQKQELIDQQLQRTRLFDDFP